MLTIKFLKGKSKIWICCFLFCSVQLIEMTINFFKFDVRFEIVYNYSQPIEVPAIDFFFPIATVFNFSAFYHRRPNELVYWCKILFNKSNVTINSVQTFDRHCSNLSKLAVSSGTWLPALLTVGDVEELTQDPRQFIHQIGFNDSRHRNLFDTKICTKKRFLSGFGILVRVSCRNGSLPLTQENTSGLGGNNFIIAIQYQIKSFFGFRFAHPKKNIKSQGSQYLTIEPTNNRYYTVIAYFHRQVTTSLPWPYRTKCLHYNKDETLTRCMNKHLLNLTEPTISIDTVIPFKQFPKNTRFTNGYLETSGLFMDLLNQCIKLVERPECWEVIYRTSAKIYIDQAPAIATNVLLVDVPITADMHIIAHEKLKFIEFLVAWYSVLGVYFGFNLYDKLKSRLGSLNKYFEKSAKEQRFGPKKRAFITVGPNKEVPLYY